MKPLSKQYSDLGEKSKNVIFKITKTAEYYILEKGLGDIRWRIDAVLIEGPHIDLIRSVTS
jgi:Holliday junction resolvase-like predicted endonuclease